MSIRPERARPAASFSAVLLSAVEDAAPPPEQLTLHVADIDLSLDRRSGSRCRAIATVAVVDQDGASLEGVAVRGHFEAVGYDRSFTRYTDATGDAVLTSAWQRPCPSFSFEVLDLRLGGYEYDPVS